MILIRSVKKKRRENQVKIDRDPDGKIDIGSDDPLSYHIKVMLVIFSKFK